MRRKSFSIIFFRICVFKKQISLLWILDYSIICFKTLGLFSFYWLLLWFCLFASIGTSYLQGITYMRGIGLNHKDFPWPKILFSFYAAEKRLFQYGLIWPQRSQLAIALSTEKCWLLLLIQNCTSWFTLIIITVFSIYGGLSIALVDVVLVNINYGILPMWGAL